MKKFAVLTSVMVFLAVVNFTIPTAQCQDASQKQLQTQDASKTTTLDKLCCIAGKYIVVRKATACKPPHKPTTEKLMIEIRQKGGCGSPFQFDVRDKTGKVTIFEGTVKPGGPKGCCLIEGKSVTGDDNIRFQGTLCKKGGKWTGKATYEDKQCKGTCEFYQR